jgi:eukaryotic-like serine/threonine-protein kinase
MLTGRLPFDGPNFLAQKREMLFTPPSGLVDGLPAALDALLRKALQPEPQRRFHTAQEFAQALAEAG